MRIFIRIAVPIALAVSAASISPAADASAQPGWRLTSVIRPCGRAPSGLDSVSAVSRTDAWALGEVVARHCGAFLEHWNGRSWRSIRIPAELSTDLNAPPVAASSAADVWVFPIPDPLGSNYALRWNGHRWSSSRFPQSVDVTSAEAFGRPDVWAFGERVREGVAGDDTYAARFNGTRWRTARLPGAPLSVDATSATDMWAVGPTDKTATGPLRRQVLVAMHWSGTGWRSFVLPRLSLPAGATGISGHVVAVSPTEFWWQYQINTGSYVKRAMAVLHCIAGKCQHIALPPNAESVLDMAPDGRGSVIISTLDLNPATYNSWSEWYEYTGRKWTGQTQLAPRGYSSGFDALAWIPGTDSVWSVGEADSSSGHARVLSEGVIARFG
jgi:hypothetical protein